MKKGVDKMVSKLFESRLRWNVDELRGGNSLQL